MTAALTPAAALARITALTPGLRGAAVLDADGSCLAGDAVVAASAGRALGAAKALHTAGPARALHARELRGADGLHVVSGGARAVAAQVGPRSLSGLLIADLREALVELAAG
jgi:hypothetical protein